MKWMFFIYLAIIVISSEGSLLADVNDNDVVERLLQYMFMKDFNTNETPSPFYPKDLVTDSRLDLNENFFNNLHKQHLMSGGAGEGLQHLSPNGNFNNKESIKTDSVLPAYCPPPNPCPVGYKGYAECEKFNDSNGLTMEFNRHYQIEQISSGACPCDREHSILTCQLMPSRERTQSRNVGAIFQNLQAHGAKKSPEFSVFSHKI
ncbi:hypothetical protein SNEBB_007247 [Seison nebaliae]|nr:hypothetical protein SNEBB_007247 [Seison nebaliae]